MPRHIILFVFFFSLLLHIVDGVLYGATDGFTSRNVQKGRLGDVTNVVPPDSVNVQPAETTKILCYLRVNILPSQKYSFSSEPSDVFSRSNKSTREYRKFETFITIIFACFFYSIRSVFWPVYEFIAMGGET